MADVTWLGDDDASVQIIEQYGHTFVKGEPTKVDDNDANMGKFKRMESVFHVGKGKADVVKSDEPEIDDEAGSELAAVKAELTARHIKFDGRAKIETLRDQLAKHNK